METPAHDTHITHGPQIPVTIHQLQNRLRKEGEAQFHFGFMLFCNHVLGDKKLFEWCVMDPDSVVVAEGSHRGNWRSVVYELLNHAYHACITHHNGGKFNYNPGIMPFDEYLSESAKIAIRDIPPWLDTPLRDPDLVWSRYRVDMMAIHKTGQNTIELQPSMVKRRRN